MISTFCFETNHARNGSNENKKNVFYNCFVCNAFNASTSQSALFVYSNIIKNVVSQYSSSPRNHTAESAGYKITMQKQFFLKQSQTAKILVLRKPCQQKRLVPSKFKTW
jgi:hypothetical protein